MRVQLALNVRDLDAAVDFYSTMFDTAPAKRKPGYANFAIDEPPLKLVLFEAPEASERLNHVGIEVFDDADVRAATERIREGGLPHEIEVEETCCHAVQNRWAHEPRVALELVPACSRSVGTQEGPRALRGGRGSGRAAAGTSTQSLAPTRRRRCARPFRTARRCARRRAG